MNRKTTLILVSAFILLGLYTWWLQASPKSPATAAPTPTVNPKLWDFTADQIVSFQITDTASGQSVVVKKDAQGGWNVVQPEAKPADPTQIATLTTNLADMAFTANITSTTDLAPFGLAKPAFALQADLVDGKSLKASIGDKIPTGTGYYVLRAGDSSPLAVADYGLQPFIDLLKAPPYFVPTPTPAPSSGAPVLPTATSP
jgi:hypothetical protein